MSHANPLAKLSVTVRPKIHLGVIEGAFAFQELSF